MSYMDTTAVENFKENLEEHMKFLEKHVEGLEGQRNVDFANSLISFYKQRGYLSDKQAFYASKFHDEVWNKVYGKSSSTGRVQKDTEEDRSYLTVFAPSVVKRFDNAAKTIKYPKTYYYIDKESKIKFQRLSESSRTPGAIAISYNRKGSDPTFCGIIERTEGRVIWRDIATNNQAFQESIKRILQDFANELAINGRKFGTCCFCGRALETKESVYAGYGPICAEKYNLPWGETEGDHEHAVINEETNLDVGL